MAERRNFQRSMSSALILLLGVFSLPLSAEMIYRFEPSLEIALAHDGYVYSSTPEEELSDQLAILRPVLPLIAESERSMLTLLYAPEAAFYSTYDDLNRLDHRADVDFTRTFSQRSSWEIGGGWLNTSDPHNELLEGDVIVPQSDQQVLTANTGFTVGLSNRMDLSLRYDYRDLEYDEADIAGYNSHVAGIEASYSAGTRSDIALDYFYQYFTYEDQGDFGTHNLLPRYIVRPSAEITLELAGGVYFHQQYSGSGAIEDPTADRNDVGFIGGVVFTRQGRRITFETGLDRQVSATGGINQSVLAHSARLRLSGQIGRRMQVALSGLARRNEPILGDQTGDIDQLRAGLDLDYWFTSHLDGRFFFDYIFQRWEDPSRLDLDYPRIGLSLIIHTRRERS